MHSPVGRWIHYLQERHVSLASYLDIVPEQHLVAKVSFPSDAPSVAATGTLHGTPRFIEHLEDTGSGSLRMMNGGSSKKLIKTKKVYIRFVRLKN